MARLVLELLAAALLLRVAATLRISAFNIRTFGDSKMSNQTVAGFIVSVSAGGEEQHWLCSVPGMWLAWGSQALAFWRWLSIPVCACIHACIRASIHLCLYPCFFPVSTYPPTCCPPVPISSPGCLRSHWPLPKARNCSMPPRHLRAAYA